MAAAFRPCADAAALKALACCAAADSACGLRASDANAWALAAIAFRAAALDACDSAWL